MKKIIAIAMTLAAAGVSLPIANAQDGPQGRPGPGMGMGGGFFAAARNEDGSIDLSKLPEQFPAQMKEAFAKADKDGDGIVSVEEFRAMPRPQFPGFQRPDFINEDGAIVIEKVVVGIKGADKNSDGLIDEGEQKAIADSLRKERSMIPMFINRILSGAPQGGPGFGGPGFGGPGFGPQGPRGPEGDAGPQGDRPRGPREGQAGPQGDRPRGPREGQAQGRQRGQRQGDRPNAGPNGQRRPNGDRPRGPRPEGDGPQGPRPDGDRPGFGGPQGGPMGGFFPGAFQDGKLDLSKLPEQFPQDRKDAMKAADKDGDGFLTMEELAAMPRPKFQFRDGQKPEFINDDNAFVTEKIEAFLKDLDKNADGVIDPEEQKALADLIREKYQSLPFFVNQTLGGGQPGFGGFGPQGPGFGGPNFGGPGFGGPGFGGPQNGQPGFRGPRGDRRGPQNGPEDEDNK